MSDERANPTAATRAAVQAIEDRIAQIQSEIAALVGADVRPVAVTSQTGVSTSTPVAVEPVPVTLAPVPAPTSPNQPPSTFTPPPSPVPPAYPTQPNQPPTSTSPPSTLGGGGGEIPAPSGLSAADAAAFIAANVYGDNNVVGQFISDNGQPSAPGDAWNYMRDQVDGVFTDIESSLSELTISSFEMGTAVNVAEIAAGTTADIASIDVVGFAGALLLGEYVIGWVISYVGSLFPNPSIFGFHPLAFIQEGIVGFGNQFKQSAKDLSQPIVDFVTQPVRQLVGLFQRSTNATASAHNKVARVVQHTVPDAIATATATAAKDTAAQIAVITDAATQAVTMLTPPPTLAQAKRIVADAQSHPTLVWQFEALAASAIVSADTYADELHTLVQGDVAAGITASKDAAAQAITTFEQTLIARVVGDETLLGALTNTVDTKVPSEISSAVTSAVATQAQRDVTATAALQSQITALQTQIATLSARVTTDELIISTAQSQLTQMGNATVVDAQTVAALQTQIANARVDIATSTTAISDLYTQLTGISDTLGPVQTAQQLNTAQLAPFEGLTSVMLPTAIATIAATLTSLKTKVDTCVVENCDPANPNNIRNVLKDLLGLLTAAAEIGFIAEAVRDPLGTANTLAPLLDSIDAGAVGTLNALLSL